MVLCRMSDLAAIFQRVFGEDSSGAFWCFASMMRSLRANFDMNEVGIRSSLGRIASMIEQVYFPSVDSAKRTSSNGDLKFLYFVLACMATANLVDVHVFQRNSLLLLCGRHPKKTFFIALVTLTSK